MKVYVDYSFYKEQGGALTEAEFERAALNASLYLNGITLGKTDSYAGDELKYATCEIADIYNALISNNSNEAGTVKSENNDGYSVTYVTEISDGETRQSLYRRKAYDVAKTWLLSTGLLSRKVGCQCGGGCCDCEC